MIFGNGHPLLVLLKMTHRLSALCAVSLVFVLVGVAGAQVAKPTRPEIRQGDLGDGQVAPDFTLQDIAGKSTVKLSGLKGKPVVLVFGSCTCPPFVRSLEAVEQLHARYKDRVHFYLIYVREAHPTDGWALPNNQFRIRSPQSIDERRRVAQAFAAKLKVSIPILVDTLDDQVEKTYACWPNRMYVLDAEGRIIDKGSAGPNGVSGSAKKAASILDRLLAPSK